MESKKQNIQTTIKKKKTHKSEKKWIVARREGTGGLDKIGEGKWEVQASCYGMTKSWG